MNYFGINYDIFILNTIYQNACALCLLQIGELVTHVSTEFKRKNKEIPWNKIKAMRNIVAHSYGSLSVEMTWMTITKSVPELRIECVKILSKQ